MTGLAIFLVALGASDLASGGLSGTPRSLAVAWLGLLAGLASLAALSWLAGMTLASILWSVLIASPGLAAWLFPRAAAPRSERACALALGGLVAPAGVWFFASRSIVAAETSPLGRFLEAHPWNDVASTTPETCLLLMGSVAVLLATSNGVVRSVLNLAGSAVVGAEQRLRGGRYIGIIERLMIFGLAAAGEPTAAALVVSAKSLLRFPELSRAVKPPGGLAKGPRTIVADVDIVTEYFLLGSLTSWALALSPALLLR